MRVSKFAISDAIYEKAPAQDADVVLGNVVDQRHGGKITLGYGRYGPDQSNSETLRVEEAMIILEGELSVTTADGTITAGPGELVYMPEGAKVAYRSGAAGAVIAYVTHPHWQETV